MLKYKRRDNESNLANEKNGERDCFKISPIDLSIWSIANIGTDLVAYKSEII